MKLTTVLTILVACVCCAPMPAQDSTRSDPGKPPQQMAMQMPTPAPEMTRLIKAIAGTWSVTETYDRSPMMPNGGTGKGSATITAGPGNLSVVEKYHSVGAMGGSFNGVGVFWWDSKAQAFHSLWCDNMEPTGCDPSGTTKWDGDNLVGTLESETNGQKMTTRYTYSDWKPNSFTMTMEMGPDANSLKKFMTITYTKGSVGAKMEKSGQ